MKIVSRTRRYHGRVFDIQDVEIESPSGAREQRELAVRKDSVGIIAIFDNGDLLLIREYALGADTHILTLPGGKVEEEDDLLRRAQFELLEETGYEAGSWKRLVSMYSDPINYLKRCVHIFVGTHIEKTEHSQSCSEGVEIVRLSPGEFLSRCTTSYFSHPEAIAAISIFLQMSEGSTK
jgi:ADP-ribose pyrophosphatase